MKRETCLAGSLNGSVPVIFTHLQVPAKESLEEAALPAAPCPQHVATEDATLGLFLLQVDAFVTSHCRIPECTRMYVNSGYTVMLLEGLNGIMVSPVIAAAWDSCS